MITMTEQKNGVFLARFQPLHVGHCYMIDKMISECNKCIILIGSANKNGMPRNPFSYSARSKWVLNYVRSKYGNGCLSEGNVLIKGLPDWSVENNKGEGVDEWGRYLYYNVVSRLRCKTFSIYYNDEPSIIEAWFQDPLIKDRVKVKHRERGLIADGISATKVRDIIRYCGFDFNRYGTTDDMTVRQLQAVLPSDVYTPDDMIYMKRCLDAIDKDGGRKDFSMN